MLLVNLTSCMQLMIQIAVQCAVCSALHESMFLLATLEPLATLHHAWLNIACILMCTLDVGVHSIQSAVSAV